MIRHDQSRSRTTLLTTIRRKQLLLSGKEKQMHSQTASAAQLWSGVEKNADDEHEHILDNITQKISDNQEKTQKFLQSWVASTNSISRNQPSTSWTTSTTESLDEDKLLTSLKIFKKISNNPREHSTIASHFCDQLRLNPRKTVLPLPNRTAYTYLSNPSKKWIHSVASELHFWKTANRWPFCRHT